MPKLTVNGSHTQFVGPLSRREDFDTHGSLHGRRWSRGTLGMLPEEYRESARNALYFVYSYDTPIAWLDDQGVWHAPRVRYSQTTSKQQTRIFAAVQHIERELLAA